MHNHAPTLLLHDDADDADDDDDDDAQPFTIIMIRIMVTFDAAIDFRIFSSSIHPINWPIGYVGLLTSTAFCNPLQGNSVNFASLFV